MKLMSSLKNPHCWQTIQRGGKDPTGVENNRLPSIKPGNSMDSMSPWSFKSQTQLSDSLHIGKIKVPNPILGLPLWHIGSSKVQTFWLGKSPWRKIHQSLNTNIPWTV